MDNPEDKQLEARLKKYAGPEGVTTRQLETGLWYVEHKKKLKLALYGFLILTAAVSWAYTIYGFAYYYIRGAGEDERLVRQLAQINIVGHDYIVEVGAKQLIAGPVGVLASDGGKYDFYSRLENVNQRWWAEFDYYFVGSRGRTEKVGGFIFPLEKKYLLALADDSAGAPAGLRLVLENISWRRLDPRQIPDWDDYYEKHSAIESADVKFTPARENALSEKLNLNRLSFNAVNRTAYNYWQVDFNILLYRQGIPAGLNRYTLNNFASGQKKFVELSWPGLIGPVDKVEIMPEINIMKDDIYIPYQGGVGQEK